MKKFEFAAVAAGLAIACVQDASAAVMVRKALAAGE